MNIIVKNAAIETYHSISMVERNHRSLCQVYSIIISEIPYIDPDLTLQIALKLLTI